MCVRIIKQDIALVSVILSVWPPHFLKSLGRGGFMCQSNCFINCQDVYGQSGISAPIGGRASLHINRCLRMCTGVFPRNAALGVVGRPTTSHFTFNKCLDCVCSRWWCVEIMSLPFQIVCYASVPHSVYFWFDQNSNIISPNFLHKIII